MRRSASRSVQGFLTRLRRDVRGNVLAIMAVSLIPLAAFTGAAIDVGRTFTVKTRLQQACDAGALAGRKSMTDTTLDTSSTGQAQTFFNNNFPTGYFGATNVSFKPSVTSDYQVAGTATATVPTTIMAMFGQTNQTLTVTCQARYDVADADIMFVLDTTGSMACTTSSDTGNGCGAQAVSYTRSDGTPGYYTVEQNGSKLSGLRAAVLSFYDTVDASADDSTHIRYGFVPYSSAVNVGALLPTSALVTQWQYQSRHTNGDYPTTTSTATFKETVSASSKSDCEGKDSRSPATFTTTRADGSSYVTYTYDKTGKATVNDYRWETSNNKNVCNRYAMTVTPVWRYEPWKYDVSNFVKFQTVADPSTVTDGSNGLPFFATKWQGCIEERGTTASTSFDPNNLPPDLDPDLKPSASVDVNGFPTSSDTRWRPLWPDVTYYRDTTKASQDDRGNTSGNPAGDTSNNDSYDYFTDTLAKNNIGKGYVVCGKAAQRLTVMTRDQVSAYVNSTDFKAMGGTYHDVGMIWGTRLISPSGIFANDTAAWPGRQPPNRYIVFMTDGTMAPNRYVYGQYGIEDLDKRVTGGTYNNQLANHNARFVAECQAAKSRNITVFVVGFGQTLNDQLKACASPGQAYYASDNDSLKTAFQKIAQQVAMLRISK